MNSFKDSLAFDAERVFLNPDEFAEIMTVNGAPMPAMWGEEIRPAPDELGATVDAWGLNSERAVLLVPQSAMPLPVPGQRLTIDGKGWTVEKSRPQNGVIRLELARNTA